VAGIGQQALTSADPVSAGQAQLPASNRDRPAADLLLEHPATNRK
jgi:hypothetical protein